METEEILLKLQEMDLIRLAKKSGDYYMCRCPIHSDGKEKNPSCGVLLHDVVRDGKVTPAGFTHCFRGDTEVITRTGIKPIAELCDKPNVQIINGNGEWETTVFHNYGIAQLWKLTLSRDQQTKVIYTTKDHEWFVDTKVTLRTTENLHPGWYLQSCIHSDHSYNVAIDCKSMWKIVSVEPTDSYDDVYCCETSTQSFVLSGNILTHNCFSCGWAKSLPDTVTEILKRRKISSQSGLEWLKENIPGFDGDTSEFDYLIPRNLMNPMQHKYAFDYLQSLTNVNKSPTYVSEEELATYRMTVPYMYQRGLTDEIIEKYDIGYDANFIPPGRKKPVPCVTFPVKDIKGNTLFLCRRSIEGKMFHYPQGVEKSVYGLYELSANPKSVIVCESCFNALTAVKYGYNAVALLGTGTSYEIQQLRMSGIPMFVLCLDGDDAGQRGAIKLKRALSDVAIVWTIHMPPDKDLNDCTKEEFDQLYSQRS